VSTRDWAFQFAKNIGHDLLLRGEKERAARKKSRLCYYRGDILADQIAGGFMSLAQRLEEVRTGFERPFWVANISEIFERLAYYGAFASLANYLRETLSFPTEQTGTLTGIFGGAVWFMAIFGGAIADKLGFRRALSLAYAILAGAYFLLGSIGAPWLSAVRNAVPLSLFVGFILILPALGIALVKPCVVGTTARASRENVRSLGFSIYYTMVNIGGLLGPFAGSLARQYLGAGKIFLIAAAAVFAMFFFVLAFFREPKKADDMPIPTIGETLRNFGTVLGNPKFMLFLLIFTGYWIVFWQQWIVMPVFLHEYVNKDIDVERILMTDSIIVITCTILVNYLTKKIPAFSAIILGTFITGISWLILAFRPSLWGAVAAIVVLAIGEIVHQPRYYEYVSRLAPAGQQGTYMGFAFLPLGIGSLVGGWFGGKVLHHFGEVMHRPQRTWFVITGVGLVTTVLLLIYDRFVKPSPAEQKPV
jgi:POT family proton-dependent oligopeptide transporter